MPQTPLAAEAQPAYRADSRAAPAPPTWVHVLLKTLFAALTASALWWLLWESMGLSKRSWSQNLFVPAGIIAVTCLAALRHERLWTRPLQRLLQLLPEARDGRAAIEELSQVGGGLGLLVPLVQELLHEIRLQKHIVAELEGEMRRRVAVRTDALERQLGSMRQQAARDALTGLYNRRMLDLLLPQLIDRCRDERLELCVLMIDVDYFKQLNDTLGHAAGDDLLRDVARLIRSSLRDQDAAFRYGGDEFVVVLPGASLPTAQATAERLAALVDALAKPLRVARPPRLSVGVARFSAGRHSNADDLLADADRQLYDVKSARRNGAALRAPELCA